ncbi:hypothetical protein pVco7_gp091 [Vibrio phage pVco-7]|uniref:Uncharacterized protein n=1 Tax=Vibrio phage pVco-5 TaxID=1965485 RepID=A0A1W6JUX7_9CAUD|nr:hypothetical protein KNT61_gp091 [Vibrio phage pVco-5]ARM71079.1 hypothetical protein pVco5_091 [Vibrio phage pVco-5]
MEYCLKQKGKDAIPYSKRGLLCVFESVDAAVEFRKGLPMHLQQEYTVEPCEVTVLFLNNK